MELFYKIGSAKGRSICRLALVRIQCEIELIKEGNTQNLGNFISIAEKAKQQFAKIGYKLGEERANAYIDFLRKKINGEEDSNLKKFMKFKTLKKTHIEQVKKESTVEKHMLQDEDIRLFVEVIEEEADTNTENRRFTTTSLSRPSTKLHERHKRITSSPMS